MDDEVCELIRTALIFVVGCLLSLVLTAVALFSITRIAAAVVWLATFALVIVQ